MDAAINTVWTIRRSGVLAVVAAMSLVSCGTVGSGRRATEYLDERSGATITRVAAPFTFYSDDSSRAANARDYLDAAPLAVNLSGRYSWWLWLGMWSTIDRGASGGDDMPPDIAAIQLIVDGEPMDLDLRAGAGGIPGTVTAPYAATVPARIMLLPLTGSQVARLARADSITIQTGAADGDARHWQAWVRDEDWTGFAELAAAQPGALP
jgi:hypothetical protein